MLYLTTLLLPNVGRDSMWNLIEAVLQLIAVIIIFGVMIICYLVIYVCCIQTLESLDTAEAKELKEKDDFYNRLTAWFIITVIFVTHAAFFGWIYTGDLQ